MLSLKPTGPFSVSIARPAVGWCILRKNFREFGEVNWLIPEVYLRVCCEIVVYAATGVFYRPYTWSVAA